MEMTFSHCPVMLDACIEGLAIRPDGLYVDCTAGGGGHSYEIAKRLDPNQGGHLIAIDQDSEAIAAASQHLAPFADRVTMVHDNFSNIKEILQGKQPDGVLIDLGVSSHQLDTAERGFSYMQDAPLDMRMDQSAAFSAYDLVNSYSEDELSRILFEYGEEKFARRIASAIVKARAEKPLETTGELVALIRRAVPVQTQQRGSHPAKRSFQAIRIEVNHELDIIRPTVLSLIAALAPGGRLAVLTFHSLEDRIVKQAFAEMAKGCICPPDFPMCVCGRKPVIDLITRKPSLPDPEECAANPRAHSAKLRIAQKRADIGVNLFGKDR